MKDTGGAHLAHKAYWDQVNMEFRSYAAIHLRIPDSGIDWLDKMIAKAERRDIATKAMQGLIASVDLDCVSYHRMAADSYDQADAMLKERAK